jgi:hypothetical protein
MKQRVPGRSWYSPSEGFHRPRVLVEVDHPALAISDFSAFRDAGFDVAVCSGPDRTPERCPLLRGEQCGLAAHADVVLHGLDRRLGVAEALRQQLPDLAVVVEQDRFADGGVAPVPAGCAPLSFSCSVQGQLDALREALANRTG